MTRHAWNDYERVMAGRRLLQVICGEGGETTLIVTPLQSEMEANQMSYVPRKATKLAVLLSTALNRAETRPGETVRTDLPGGLRVDLALGRDGNTRILLARRGVAPSDTEWSVTLAHFPYDVSLAVEPERFEYKGWRCLRAAWPTPEVE